MDTMPAKPPLWQRPKVVVVTFFIFITLVVGILGTRALLSTGVPAHEGKIRIAGLQNEVKVIWDDVGVPHITAQNQEDLFFAYGRIVASERLFQMDLQRRLARGELSEIFGEKTLAVDKFFRTLRLTHWARDFFEHNLDKLNPQMIKAMESFYKGVNSYIQTGERPLEMRLLKYRPKNFSMEDALAYGAVMAFHFQDAPSAEPLKTFLKENFSPQINQQLWPEILAPKVGLKKEVLKKQFFSQVKNAEIFDDFSLVPSFDGSNAWVLGPTKTSSGRAILANDPHIGFSQPGVWFEAHLKAPDFEVYGLHLPILPFALLGHTPHHAWGLTMSEVDDMDFYVEKLQPEDQAKVLYNGEWERVQQFGEKIIVKDKEEVILPIRVSRHGPFVDHLLKTPAPLKEGEHLSVYWPFLSADNFLLETFYQLPRISAVNELPQILSLANGPGLNVLYADRDGHIAWYMMGKIIKRPPHVDSLSFLNGSLKADDPQGFYPFEANPFVLDPPSGMIVSANDRPRVTSAKTPKITGHWQGPQRYNRIENLLKEKATWKVDELKIVQTDDHFTEAPTVLSPLISVMEKESGLDEIDQTMLSLLKAWKGEHGARNPAPLIFWQWIYEINTSLSFDELQNYWGEYLDLPVSWQALENLVYSAEADVWDNQSTQNIERRDEVVIRSWKKMKEKLLAFGKNPRSWRWGFKHSLTFKHAMGKKWPLTKIFNLGPFEVNGGNFQINHMKFHRSLDDFSVFHGPSVRRIIEMQDIPSAQMILPTGNSGHALSPHYGDQVAKFLQGQYREAYFEQAKIDAKSEGTVILAPHDSR